MTEEDDDATSAAEAPSSRVADLEARIAVQSLVIDALQKQNGAESRRRRAYAAAASIAVLAAGVWVHSEIEDARRRADAAYSTAGTALSQANAAAQRAANAEGQARQALLQASEARRSAPLAPAAPWQPRFDPIVRPGHVTATKGSAPVSTGAECTVTVTSASGGNDSNCKVESRCAGVIVYGKPGSGYLVCNTADGKPTFGRDDVGSAETGDPKIELDLAHDRVVIGDGPDPEYSFTISLATPNGASRPAPTARPGTASAPRPAGTLD